MKSIFLIVTLVFCAPVLAGSVDGCKAAGEQAEKIMQRRQSEGDLINALNIYKNQEMVMSAFERPRYDSLAALSSLIDAKDSVARQIADVRYEEVSAKVKNEIELFKMKYFKSCILSK